MIQVLAGEQDRRLAIFNFLFRRGTPPKSEARGREGHLYGWPASRAERFQVVLEDPGSLKAVAVALIFGVVAFGESCASEASHRLKAPPNGRMPVAVENLDKGRIRLDRDGRRLVVDLAREISGCTGRRYDLTVNEEHEAGVDFEIVDETEKAAYTYLVLLASAPPNCNVQGHCGGGGSDSTLIWLKVTKDLSLAGKQAFPIDECRAGRFANVFKEEDPEDYYFGTIQAKDLPWIGDLLQIEYQERDKDSIQRLVYDRQDPEAGLRRIP
jgi:hypothetical protein